jgi:pilus retraction protein PilT
LEAFRIFLSAIPCLADRVLERVASTLAEGGEEREEMQAGSHAHQAAAATALARLREGRLIYRNVLYPHLSHTCQDCGEPVVGAYWELVNPVTHVRGVFRTRLVHELLSHRRSSYQEPIVNLSGAIIAMEEHTWDFEALLRILDGLSIPTAVFTELHTRLQPLEPAPVAAENKGGGGTTPVHTILPDLLSQSSNPLLPILHAAVGTQATDLHLRAQMPPRIFLDGRLQDLPGFEQMHLDPLVLPHMIFGLLPPACAGQFRKDKDLETTLDVPGLARFRVNVFQSTGTVAAVLRLVHSGIRSLDALSLPPVLKRVALEKQGLILVTGLNAAGKTSTLAALTNFINETVAGHIVTLEDPIEVVHPHKQCLVSQREVGQDTHSCAQGLRAALRQTPHVIVLSDIFDRATIELALRGAQAGHLIIAGLQAGDIRQGLEKLVYMFPDAEHTSVLWGLASTLKCVVSQQLVPRCVAQGRVALFDVLLQTPEVQALIREGGFVELAALLEAAPPESGMQSKRDTLLQSFRSGVVDYATCLAAADDKSAMTASLRESLQAIRADAEALAGRGRPTKAPRAALHREPVVDYLKVIKVHPTGGGNRSSGGRA